MITYEQFDQANDGFVSSIRNCLDMVRRHGPRLLRTGGGHIEGTHMEHSTPEERAEIVAAYHANKSATTDELAARFRRSPSFISATLRKAGIRRENNTIFGAGNNKSVRNPAYDLACAEFLSLAPEVRHGRMSAIARKHGLPPQNLCTKLKRLERAVA